MTTLFIPTLHSIVENHYEEGAERLEAALLEREDLIADALRLFGANFGLYPEVVSEVLTNAIPLGTPQSEAAKVFVRLQYEALVQRLNNPPSTDDD